MDLIATGPDPRQRWRIRLHPNEPNVLGREHDGPLVIRWDSQISRRHAIVTVHNDALTVHVLPEAKNPVFFRGETSQDFQIRQGEHFVIGQTTFELESPDWAGALTPAASPIDEVTFSRQALQGVRFRDADKRIEVLSNLPEVIWGARTDTELFSRLVNLLLAGITQAEAAAIVHWKASGLEILHWDRRRETEGEIRPSVRLIREAIEERQQSILHVWEKSTSVSDYTVAANTDWAFCTPVIGTATNGWGLYVTGAKGADIGATARQHSSSAYLEADVKFAELVAEIVSSVRRLRQLERQQAGLRQFFAPAVLAAVGENLDTGLLAPREADVTILFCDLRGFSKQAESSRKDLLGLLDRVSQAMGIMTRHILAHGGGIGDFLGDSAMGFWGWPVASPVGPLEACRAALSIRQEFDAVNRQPGHPLANFQMGIGIAHGRAVAGKIGTNELVKVTVFGPVVNLASRLEGMTKQLRVPILLDETVAEMVREKLARTEGRIRTLAKVLPYGMETCLLVSELVPPLASLADLSDQHLATYDQAVEHFIAGRWEAAYEALHKLPASDKAQDFLAVLIAQHNRQPPPGWDGIVKLPNK